jgi:hypothetical protein
MTLSISRTAGPQARRVLIRVVIRVLAVGLLLGGVAVTPAAPARAATCPCTIWPASAVPGTPAVSDTQAVELGVKVRADSAGYITAVRFYKGSGNTGTHVGNLWSSTGTQLATGTFSGESATGWQQLTFASPVAVSAGTTYVASYYAPVGHYSADNNAFASAGVDNPPLHALANGVDGADGVYRYGSGGGFPTNTYQSSNYWVDVVFATSAMDTTPPTVATRSPSSGATGVSVSTTVAAAFSEDVTAAQVALSRSGSAVAGSTAYDAASRTVTFNPSAALAPSTTYSATVSGARDAAGNTMAASSWTFTTGASTAGCPCTLWPSSTVPATASQADNSAVEVGTRFTTATSGYVTAIRFYKGAGNTGTHVGHLWTASGSQLASATFTGESASGWQQVTLPAPVAVSAGSSYVASYYAPVGGYAVNSNYFSAARSSPPLTAPASTTAAPNGLYLYGPSGFPTSTFNASNYWVDVVFNTTATDTVAPTVTSRSPAPSATGVDVGTSVTATFSEPVRSTSIAFTLTGPGGAMAGGTAYDSASSTATFTPSAALAAGTTYTASVAATDTEGNAMAAPTTWSFTTLSTAPPPPTAGPVLVVARSPSFGGYLPEILKAEGVNEYATSDLSGITASNLAGYDVVLLGETPLTAAQVSTLTTWVNGGGNLVAMRPDKQLAGLLGLTTASGTVLDGYLQVDTSQAPGAGITDQTIQFHGTADRWTTASAQAVASLLSSPTAATGNPAVTLRTVGTLGGHAAAFAYDLARSVVYTRQGNPAFAGQERDGQAPIRSDDLFWGSTAQNGYLNLDKVAIPQADEQQRLLVNLLETMNRAHKPLPRFWYFPRMEKAVLVNTGDDHGNGGTAGRFEELKANSPAGCSVALWTCLRSTSYIYASTPLTNSQAKSYVASGFEVSLHPQNGCKDYTPSSLENDYATQLSAWQSKYSSVPAPSTMRYHCLVWSDWASQPKTEARHGIALDTNYYYWPPEWLNDRPGFMTGSGMPMQYADTNGSVLGVYQAATDMTDESGQSYPGTPNTLFANALGPLGYYGAFVANEHTDNATTFDSDQLIDSALSYGVPMISARQLLTWVSGRDASRYSGISWSGSSLAFTIAPGAGADGLMGMVPTDSRGGTLTSITRGGTSVPFTTDTLKGVSYATFSAAAGSYTATYSGTSSAAASYSTRSSQTGPASLTASAPAAASPAGVLSLPDGTARVRWSTPRPTGSVVELGTSPDGLVPAASAQAAVTQHELVVTGLTPGATYYYRVRSSDASQATAVRSFVQAAAGVAQSTAAGFRVGRTDRAGTVTTAGLQLAGAETVGFDTPARPGSWSYSSLPGGRSTVLGGSLQLDGSTAEGARVSGPARLAAQAAFTGPQEELGLTGAGSAVFAVRAGHLVVAVSAEGRHVQAQLPDSLMGAWHEYAVSTTAGGVRMEVDGREVARLAVPLAPARLVLRDAVPDGSALLVDSVQRSPYSTSSTYVSRVLDARAMVTWDRASWQVQVPAGTALQVSVRTGSRSTPDASWTAFRPLSGSGAVLGTDSRYLQYRVVLTTRDRSRTPVLSAIAFTHNGSLASAPTIEGCGAGCRAAPAAVTTGTRSPSLDLLVWLAVVPLLASGFVRRRARRR